MKKWIRIFVLLPAVLLLFLCLSPANNDDDAPLLETFAPVTASPPREEVAQPPQDTRATLVVAGDLMVHTEQMLDARVEETKAYDFTHCFAPVAGDLAEGYGVGNLETVFGGEDLGYSDYPHFSAPDSFGEALRDSGFDFLTTANNHCLDQGEAGLLRTLEVLDALGVAHTGTFASASDRDAICIREVDGLSIAFLSYTFSTNGIPVPEDKAYLVNMIEDSPILEDIRRAHALGPDLIVVLPYMSNEYETVPRDAFLVWMDLMIHNGADLVLASHPHVLQTMEVKEVTDAYGETRNAFLICSLGNFVSSQRYEKREAGLLLKLDIHKRGDKTAALEGVRFVPTWVQFYDENGDYLVRVLPVCDTIRDYKNGGNTLSLRPVDVQRLYRVHDETTALYLGQAVAREDMKREYVFY